jgi:hypothetical protein
MSAAGSAEVWRWRAKQASRALLACCAPSIDRIVPERCCVTLTDRLLMLSMRGHPDRPFGGTSKSCDASWRKTRLVFTDRGLEP